MYTRSYTVALSQCDALLLPVVTADSQPSPKTHGQEHDRRPPRHGEQIWSFLEKYFAQSIIENVTKADSPEVPPSFLLLLNPGSVDGISASEAPPSFSPHNASTYGNKVVTLHNFV